MKRRFVFVCVCAFAALAALVFAGEYTARALSPSGGAAVTNDQANARWDLSGVLVQFTSSPTGQVQIVRDSRGVQYLLAAVNPGCTSIVWWADQTVPFAYGDVVRVIAPGGAGTVQVLKAVGR